jgi:hypothetical protein
MPRERWHRLPEKDQAQAVSSIADWLWRDQEPIRKRLLELTKWFEGHSIPSLDASAYSQRSLLRSVETGDVIHWNTPRAIVQTVTAKIAGRQRPKPSLVVTDADWATKRRAKRLERFAEATLHQPQGPYRDTWELATQAFLDCCVWGTGAIKTYADVVNERIARERVLPWQLLVDPLEAETGNPLNMFHRYRYDKDRLIAEFPQHADAIHMAKVDEPTSWGTGLRIARSCTVYEAWRLPLGDKDKGRHSICIDKRTIHSEEWTREEFPFLIFRWSRHLLGFLATSLIEETLPMAEELNFTIERMREGERKLAAGYLTYEEGSVDEEKLKETKIGALIPHRTGSPPPQVGQPQGYSESTLKWMQLNFDKSYELPGVSQMTASSRKEQGVTAGIALRTIAAMETERFSLAYTMFEQGVAVDLTRHTIDCAREVAKKNKNFAVSWPGSGFLREISWSDADLENAQYSIQTESVSGIANTPADRLQLAQDLYNAGILTPDQFVRVVQFGKDIDGELRGRHVQHQLIERYIEQWLDATPEQEAEGGFEFKGPVPWMKLPDAILQIGDAYMQAEMDGAPAWNLDHFVRFITDAGERMMKQAAAPVPPPPPQPGAGPPPGAPVPPAAPGPAQVLN